LTEYYLAVDGYWRNWERNTAWLMRELVFAMINGNPYIKDKPSSPRDIFKIKDDKIQRQDKMEKKVSPEELEEVRKKLIQFRDGTT